MNKIVTSLVCEHLERIFGKSGLARLGAFHEFQINLIYVLTY